MNLSVVAAIITIFLSTIHLVDAVAAYVFYKDAVCSNGSYIKGQLYYAYDTYSMKGQGFKVRKYNGPCKYFEGGRYDLEYADNDGNFMKNGYCIRYVPRKLFLKHNCIITYYATSSSNSI
jgi:hypothetical protein